MIPRELEKKAKELAKQFPVIAILGPRQSGKTTLTKKAFPNHKYVSLELPDVREFALNDPKGFFLSLGNDGIILDEVQHVPSLLSYIQVLSDESGESGKFILTGSENYLLNEKITQSLAGRVALLTLLPLSISELATVNRLPPRYETLILQGGYPRLYSRDLNPYDLYANYIQTYVERDIRQLKNVSDLSTFQKFVKLCATRIGQLVNWSDIGRDCGISHNTAKAWVSLLEATYILFLLPPYYNNFSKRLTKSSKLYFYDTGLASTLLNISSEEVLNSHPLKGALFESLIVSELMKSRLHKGLAPSFYFWRDKEGHEMDALLEADGKLFSYEIKSTRTLSQDLFAGLSYWQRLTQQGPEHSVLIYGGDEKQQRSQGGALPWSSIK